jgi:integrase
MLEDMQLRNLCPETQRAYVHYIIGLARFYQTSPEHLSLEELREYQLYLTNERRLSPESVNQFVSAAKFLYNVTLETPWPENVLPRARVPHKLPVVLSEAEVYEFFQHVCTIRYRAALMTAYGAGLRVSEVVTLQVGDIDSPRMLIRVRQGKGKRDRYAMLSPRLLEVLKRWWRSWHPAGQRQKISPEDWVFPGWRKGHHMNVESLQTACREAARAAGLSKRITVHTLRHALAYYTTFPTRFILKTIRIGQARFAAVYGPGGPLSPVAAQPPMTNPSGRLSTEHTLPHVSPVECVLG